MVVAAAAAFVFLGSVATGAAAHEFYVCHRGQVGADHRPCAYTTTNQVNAARLPAGTVVAFDAHDVFGGAGIQARSGVRYTSYGPGRATIRPDAGQNGITFWGAYGARDVTGVTVSGLAFVGPGIGASRAVAGVYSTDGANSGNTIERCTILGWVQGIVMSYRDSGWTITGNTISGTSLNGIFIDRHDAPYIGPQGDVIADNSISHTGLDPTWGGNTAAVHAIYDDSIDTLVYGNTITDFASSGITIRFGGSVVEDNTIDGRQAGRPRGAFGISFFDFDPHAGAALWIFNRISGVTTAGIYVDGGAGGPEASAQSFTIADNAISMATTVPGSAGIELDLDRSAPNGGWTGPHGPLLLVDNLVGGPATFLVRMQGSPFRLPGSAAYGNEWWPSSSGLAWSYDGRAYSSLAAYRAATGQGAADETSLAAGDASTTDLAPGMLTIGTGAQSGSPSGDCGELPLPGCEASAPGGPLP
ncbi:MAG: right-handed parallel beta-helix repeat-containing protein [Solirubrobacteraceae bacterium]